jgi:hypothetical protein
VATIAPRDVRERDLFFLAADLRLEHSSSRCFEAIRDDLGRSSARNGPAPRSVALGELDLETRPGTSARSTRSSPSTNPV